MENQFRFFRNYYEVAKDLAEVDEKGALQFLFAVCEYMLNDNLLEVKGAPKAMFTAVKFALDTSKQKSSAGKAGGKQNGSKPKANPKQIESTSEADWKQTGSRAEADANESKKVRKIESNESKKDRKVESNPPYPPTGVEDWGDPFPDEPLPPKEPSAYEERFERFWSAYPRKVGKGECRRIWQKLKPSEELTQTMLSAVETAKGCDQWKRDGGQYIPYPSTWLHQGRWEDSPSDKPEDQSVDYSQFTDADWLAV